MPPEQASKASPETAIAVMSRDIHYMKESLQRVEVLMSDAAKNYVTHMELTVYQQTLDKAQNERDRDLATYKSEQGKICDDHEERMRVVEKSTTQILTWGSISIVLLGALEFIISKYF